MKSVVTFGTMVLLGLSVIGCGSSAVPAKQAETPAVTSPAKESPNLLLSEEPKESKSVISARQEAKDGDEVVIEGRVGGAVNPWVEGRASFQIVDRTLVPCNERPGDDCPTPWDYCCDSDTLPKSKATIKFVDDQGKTIATDARKLLGIKELQTVVVKGLAKRDEAGNLIVVAKSLFARPDAAQPKSSEKSP